MSAFVLAAAGLGFLGVRWVRRSQRALAASGAQVPEADDQKLDAELEDELRRLDDR
jgi:hypothetical protein